MRPARGEWWGGLAAMLVALPSSIAFGVAIFSAVSPQLAGSGALAGVVGAAALGMIAPAVSRNGGFISSPCAPAAAVMSGLGAGLALDTKFSAPHVLVLLALTALISAVLQIAYGTLRFGRLMKYIPYQVVTGYSCGVAVIIAAGQIPRLLGVSARRVSDAVVSPEKWKWPGIVVGVVTIAVMVLAPKITKKVPASILALTAGIVTYFGLAALWDRSLLHIDHNPLIIGPIRAAGSVAGPFGAFARMTPADLLLVIGPAVTLSLLLSIDTLKTGVLLDSMLRERHNSDRELIGQGFANAAAALAGGVPGSAGTGPTVVNVTSGGQTYWSGVIEGVLALGVFLAFRGAVAWLPTGALAGILLVIAWRMFDFKIFRLLTVPSTRLDFFVIAAVIIVAASIGLIQATATGVALTILLFIRVQLHANVIMRKSDLRETGSKRRRNVDELHLLALHGHEGLLVQLRGDLFFGTTDQLYTDLERDLSSRRFILLDFRRVESMDYTAAHLLTQMKERLAEHGGLLLFSGMPSSARTQQDMEDYLRKLAIVSAGIGIFDSRDSALEWMEDRVLQAHGWTPAESKPPLTLAEIPVFHNFEPAWLEELLALVRTRQFDAEQQIFGIGDKGDEIFFVRKGRVHIELPLEGGKKHHLATMGRGDFFGEMSFLDRGPRSADAEAATRTELFALSRSAFDRIDQALAGRIFEQLAFAIAQRLRVADAELRALEER